LALVPPGLPSQERRNDSCLYMNDDLYIFKEGERHGGEAEGYVAGSDTLARVRPTWPKFRPSLPRGPFGC
jgi:hypothetical protein